MIFNLNDIFIRSRTPINLIIYRYLRNISRRSIGPKLLKGKVKTTTEIEDYEEEFKGIDRYKDSSGKINSKFFQREDVEVETALNIEEYSSAVENIDSMFDMHLSEEKELKRKIRKDMTRQKHFKCEKETNLLTHAAKKQIHYLHQLNPLKWTPEKLSECFPISIKGIKKLLKNNFVLTSPERIKQHDEEVAKRWKMLKSGHFSTSISPITLRLWQEGKLIEGSFMGNPNLPNVSDHEKHHVNKKKSKQKKEVVGEYLGIIKNYLEYKENLILLKARSSNVKESSKDDNKFHVEDSSTNKSNLNYSELNPKEPSPKELRRINKERLKALNSKFSSPEMPHSQFTENMYEHIEGKTILSSIDDEYKQWINKQKTIAEKVTPKRPFATEKLFTKIEKFNKDSVEAKFEKDSSRESIVYLYDDTHGYQFPQGKIVKSRIKIPPRLYKKGYRYQVGNSVYSDDGEFLYKVP